MTLLHFLPEYATLKLFHLELSAGHPQGAGPHRRELKSVRARRRPPARGGPRGV